MRKGIFFVILLLPFLVLLLFSPALATKSRLMGMGDLSIVIEDESNMINLWDFGHNPAGFLSDEKGTVVRGDLMYGSYEVKDIPYYSYYSPQGYVKYKADGSKLDGSISVAIREEGNYALGVGGSYLHRDLDSEYADYELKSPSGLLVFSKTVGSAVTCGGDIAYSEKKYDYGYGTSEPSDKDEFKDFSMDLGALTDLGSGVTLGALLGYNSFKPDEDTYMAKSYSWRFAGQSVVEVADKLELGVETAYTISRGNFLQVYLDYIFNDYWEGKENYYFSSVRVRGMYHMSSKLRFALFYFDREPFIGFYEPVYAYTSLPGYTFFVRHYSMGVSYEAGKNILMGAEYHFRDSAEPSEHYFQGGGLKNESLNLGIEGELSESVTIRGGFIRSETNQNPNFDKKRDTWQSNITSGFSYQPSGSKFLLELSYIHTFGKFYEYYGPWIPKLSQNTVSLSFKTTL